ncbi:unnamed protein product [Thelazia callipaeda]|uniref:Uncharacterized protein n=1 Tax=Thelazia callipaeda TaxID=103827 RepID=A0A3P7LBW0_THECL|nr:unnamed protein product [Thelazia callipaeda]
MFCFEQCNSFKLFSFQIILLLYRVLDYVGINLREQADLYLLVTLQVAARAVQSKKLNIGANKESIETLFMECDGVIPDESKQTQRVQLQMSLWHDALSGFSSYFHGQIRVNLVDDALEHKDLTGSRCYKLFCLNLKSAVIHFAES